MEINEKLILDLIEKINEVNKFQDDRVTELANLTLRFVGEVKKNAVAEESRIRILEKLFSDYATRLSISTNRTRSEIIEELNSDIQKSLPQTHLKIV